MSEKEEQLLVDFGLTRLEAMIYTALIQEPAVTGYRISHIIGKPTANVYKALSSLLDRGLIIFDDCGKAREYSPVPVSDWLKEEELRLKRQGRALEEGLSRLSEKAPPARINRLSSFDQVLGKALGMIEDAEHIIVVDAFPEVLDRLKKTLEKRARSGVTVLVHTYSPYTLEGCRIIVPRSDSAIWHKVPERAFDVACEGTAFLISNFTLDYSQVIEALYGGHVYLSLMIFNSLAKAILVYELQTNPASAPRPGRNWTSLWKNGRII